jgi:hypothetical protein
MSTLEEIEQAVKQLSPQQQQELLLRLAHTLREQDALPEPRQFTREQIQEWIREDEEGMKRFRELS